ncbi:MAG: hypothetical protein ACEQSH_00305 [Bacteroidia bacterium]
MDELLYILLVIIVYYAISNWIALRKTEKTISDTIKNMVLVEESIKKLSIDNQDLIGRVNGALFKSRCDSEDIMREVNALNARFGVWESQQPVKFTLRPLKLLHPIPDADDKERPE